MIKQNEIPAYVSKALPELSNVCATEKGNTPYKIAREMMRYTRAQLAQHNLQGAKKCVKLADQLYKKGNATMKNAIENVYVFSLSNTFLQGIEGKNLQKMLPAKISELYSKQVIYSHI